MNPTNDLLLITDLLSGAEVERQTGIRQATLRMWEKRYGFPQPLRNRHGARVYPLSQVERLQAVRRLMDRGVRPGKIFSSGAALEATDLDLLRPAAGEVTAAYLHIFSLLRAYRRAELHSHFQHQLLDLGLRRFVIEFLAPLSTAVGLAWSRGDLPVRCEHFYTQMVTSILHAKQAAVRTSGEGRPRVVLATLTGEPHVLGIMMAEAVMASLGMNCIQLGNDTPLPEVAAAAQESGADIVALSFSSYSPSKSLKRTLMALRAGLPSVTAIWAGGAGVPASAGVAPGIEVIKTLDAIAPALMRWRSRFTAQELAAFRYKP